MDQPRSSKIPQLIEEMAKPIQNNLDLAHTLRNRLGSVLEMIPTTDAEKIGEELPNDSLSGKMRIMNRAIRESNSILEDILTRLEL
jgi:hypothetical protein